MPPAEHPIRRETAHKLARYTLFSFIVTFVLSRICVFLIMSDEMPNFYFFLHGTHVHHLNYGIFLMAVGLRLQRFPPADGTQGGNHRAAVWRGDGADVR